MLAIYFKLIPSENRNTIRKTHNMIRTKFITSFLGLLFLVLPLISFTQVDEELGFIYMKGEYLMETKRYNDAINEYSQVIRMDPSYKDALLKRAEAEYILGAYRGVQDDVNEYISIRGITPKAIELLGSTAHHLGDHEAAINSLATAAKLNPNDGEIWFLKAKSNYAIGNMDQACSDLNRAKKAGAKAASDLSKKYCSGVSSSSGKVTKPRPGKDTSKPSRPHNTNSQDENSEDNYADEQEYVEPEPEEPKQPFDDSVNDIEVDEDLTLVIKNGLGGRAVKQQPNILILSDDSGTVGIDICVDASGKVTSATLNGKVSTLSSRSIVSLATRKAKEFWFAKSEWEETCGTILFNIAGR